MDGLMDPHSPLHHKNWSLEKKNIWGFPGFHGNPLKTLVAVYQREKNPNLKLRWWLGVPPISGKPYLLTAILHLPLRMPKNRVRPAGRWPMDGAAPRGPASVDGRRGAWGMALNSGNPQVFTMKMGGSLQCTPIAKWNALKPHGGFLKCWYS